MPPRFIRWTALAAVILIGFYWLIAQWQPARGTVHIALVAPLSGPTAADGQDMERGIRLLLDELNRRGGVAGRQVELDVYDDRNEPAEARRRAEEIVAAARAVGVIGHAYSSCSLAAAEVYRAAGIPAISVASTATELTRDNPWYFRTIFDNEGLGQFLAVYAREVLSAESICIIHENRGYGADLARTIWTAALGLGLQVPRIWSFDPDAANQSAAIAAIVGELAALPDCRHVVLAVQPPAGVEVVRMIAEAELEVQLLTGDALASDAFVAGLGGRQAAVPRSGHPADGLLVAMPILRDSAPQATGDFIQAFRAIHGEDPSWRAPYARDAAALLLDAVDATGDAVGTDLAEQRERVRDHLAATSEDRPAFAGVTGPIIFDEDGNALRPVAMGQFQRGEIVSALTQLITITENSVIDAYRPAIDPGRLIELPGVSFYRTSVVFTGLDPHRFYDLDLEAGEFSFSGVLWFRYRGDFAAQEVVFTNAVAPLELGAPLAIDHDDGMSYTAYRLEGRFRVDATPHPYGYRALGISLRNADHPRHDLIYAIDDLGMGLAERRQETTYERLTRFEAMLPPDSEWAAEHGWFFTDTVSVSTHGTPRLLALPTSELNYSRFNVGLLVRESKLSIRGWITGPGARRITLIAGLALLLLIGGSGLNLVRRYDRTVWFANVVLALLLLMASEPVVGVLVEQSLPAFYSAALTRAYDGLWWIVPALLMIGTIERFVWRPLERTTNQLIPTLVRRSVAFVILLLALLGVVAFVFDQKISSLLATSGVVAMILGLALQINISNIFSGIALNLERPFRIGDWIMIHGRQPVPESSVIGCVVDINWRTTRLRTTDNSVVIIPNSSISEKTITNFMFPTEISRFRLNFVVDYRRPPEEVVPVILAGVLAVCGEKEGPLAEPPPKVRVNEPTPDGVEYQVRYKIIPREVSPAKARNTVTRSVLAHLREAGIPVAHPARDLRIVSSSQASLPPLAD